MATHSAIDFGANADALAVRIMTDPGLQPKDRQKKLAELSAEITRAVNQGPSCPYCEADGPHEDNGERGRDLEYRCSDCGEAFGPATEV